ncbi:MAG: nucleotide exchange factor GrpE [bacterium]
MEEEREQELEVKQEYPVEEEQESLRTAVNPEEAGVTEEASQEDRLTALSAKCGELNDKYLRLYAEFENYRKKVSKEKQDLIKYGAERLAYELLSVVDTLELGLQHASEGESEEGVRTGIEMTLKEFLRVLEKFGVKRVDAAGKAFDPKLHEAMTQIVNDETDEGTVIDEFRKGYLYHEKLLRPSLVSVSKKSEAGKA